MPTAERRDYLTIEEYLAGEEASEVRHEYIGGIAYAMAGTTENHNIISGNIFAAIHGSLAREKLSGICQ